jgi:glutamyl/glutaminyl-tRNA synthetase
LHLGSALSAVASRRFADERGGMMLLRIDDTDAAVNVPGAVETILADLEWLGVRWDEGPARQTERAERHREAAQAIGSTDDVGAVASAVDDFDFGVTHVIRGSDHRPNDLLQIELIRALGGEPPEFVHHGLLLGEDGRKLSRHHGAASVADLREAGLPAEAVRAYLEELGLPRHDIRLDPARLRRLAVDAIAGLPDEELAARVGVPVRVVPVLRGARNLAEAREFAATILEPPSPAPAASGPTLERFGELRARSGNGLDSVRAKELVRELKAVGGDLKTLRLALTGRERGPELSAVLVALPRDETLRRIDAAL